MAAIPSEEFDNSSDDPGLKAVKDGKCVRVKEFHSISIVTSTNSGDVGKSLLYSYLFDNPAGNIPSSLINWVAKTAMPKALEQTKKAGDKYDSWKK